MTSKERARLRGLANGIETVLQIGKDGIGENLIHQADITLEARELIKGRVLEGCASSPREAAEALAAATDSEVIQVIGSKFVLYRKKKAAGTEKKASKPHDRPRKANAGLRKPFRADRDERRKPFKPNRDEQRKPFRTDRPGQRKGVKSGNADAAQRKAVRHGSADNGPRKPFKTDRAGQRKPLQASRPGPHKTNAGPRKPFDAQRKPFSRPGLRKADGGNRRK